MNGLKRLLDLTDGMNEGTLGGYHKGKLHRVSHLKAVQRRYVADSKRHGHSIHVAWNGLMLYDEVATARCDRFDETRYIIRLRLPQRGLRLIH